MEHPSSTIETSKNKQFILTSNTTKHTNLATAQKHTKAIHLSNHLGLPNNHRNFFLYNYQNPATPCQTHCGKITVAS